MLGVKSTNCHVEKTSSNCSTIRKVLSSSWSISYILLHSRSSSRKHHSKKSTSLQEVAAPRRHSKIYLKSSSSMTSWKILHQVPSSFKIILKESFHQLYRDHQEQVFESLSPCGGNTTLKDYTSNLLHHRVGTLHWNFQKASIWASSLLQFSSPREISYSSWRNQVSSSTL